jgi:hypothetical protein
MLLAFNSRWGLSISLGGQCDGVFEEYSSQTTLEHYIKGELSLTRREHTRSQEQEQEHHSKA